MATLLEVEREQGRKPKGQDLGPMHPAALPEWFLGSADAVIPVHTPYQKDEAPGHVLMLSFIRLSVATERG